ncbi:MAG: RagB/SusD family nutrient uptake outer membrane protein [Paludibacter sp.]|nr:RagB/SusD family nutrient uptake outer membrane protein [Paludibacter sp.]
MKKTYIISICLFISFIIVGCSDFLDTNPGTRLTDKIIATDYSKVWDFGYAPYLYLKDGFSSIDNNLLAAITDEAEQTSTSSNAELFNNGSWSAYNNPADVYSNCYKGIRAASYFIDNFKDYKNRLALNRDTISDHQAQYKKDISDIGWMRAEAHILRSWYYAELIKRYGDVPFVNKVLSINENTILPRTNYDSIVNYIVSEIDLYKDSVQLNWKTSAFISYDGRIDKGAALAIKARVLLYAASPLHNPSNDINKWTKAANAAHDVIALKRYSLDASYSKLFVSDYTAKSNESIWAIRLGQTNTLERQNYPIATIGGKSGVTPSQNLASDYEYKGTPNALNPYINLDPRFGFSIVTNGDTWNGRTIQTWDGGSDGLYNKNASKTGYYLKKFLTANINLSVDTKYQREWMVFRYADILLNYAEAMNEAFGPDIDNGFGMTARQAVNAVRARTGVAMPVVVAVDKTEMRIKIKHERKIELAFEDHRYWDLIRWKDAEKELNKPLLGIKSVKNTDGTFTYSNIEVENRVFDASKMYYFPIPQVEIVKSNGVLIQNVNW